MLLKFLLCLGVPSIVSGKKGEAISALNLCIESLHRDTCNMCCKCELLLTKSKEKISTLTEPADDDNDYRL